MSYSEIIANRIRSLIVERGVEQQEFARAIGITPSALTNYLTGTRKFPVERIPQVADYFGVSIDYIYGRDL